MQTAPTIYYRDQDFLVTAAKVKSPRKTYRVDRIEKVSIRRDPFYISLAVTLFLGLFLLKFGSFFGLRAAIILYIMVLGTFVLHQFSIMFITSKAVSEFAFFGLHSRLENVRSGIEKAMHKETDDDGFGSSGDDEAEDE